MRETLDAERVIAWLYDAPGQAVTPYATDAPGEPGVLEAWAETPLDQLPFGCTVLLESRPVEVEDAQADDRVPAELAAELGLTSVRFEPLLAGSPVGMVSIEPAEAAARPELHSLLPLLAAGVGRIVSRHESDRERHEAEFLLELTQAADSAGSIDAMLATICERTAAATGARRATIFLLERGRLTARAARGGDGSYDQGEWALLRAEPPPPLVEAAIQSGRPAVAASAASPLLPESWSRSLGVGSAVAVPFVSSERTVGALVLDDAAPDRFSADQIRLAEATARHVAGPIDQALVSDERTAHLRAATAIRRLLEEGASASSVREAGEVLARITRDALASERATLLLQNENDEIEHVISVGQDGEFERVLKERIGRSPAREFRIWRLTTRQPKPIFVENARASRLIPPELVEELELLSYVAVPLLSASRPLGLVLCSHSRTPRRWTVEERQLVTQIALEGSLVVENAVLRATEQARLHRMTHQAFHDTLTKLPNRALFSDRLQHALDRMTRRQESIAVLFLDLDEFKPVNDSFGHDAGDRLLISVGRRLQGCLRPEDTVARIGGDEFTVLLEDITDVRYAIRVAERIGEAFSEPFQLNGQETSVTASIGIAVGTGRESTPDGLVQNSDRAMYEAKRSGKARFVVFHEGMSADSVAAEPAEPEPPVAEPVLDETLEPEDVLEVEPVVQVEVAPEAEPADEAEPAEQIEPEADELVEIEIHRESDEPEAEPQQADSTGNGSAPEPEPGLASTLSEARRRRRRRLPPR